LKGRKSALAGQPYAARREALYGPLRAEGLFTWDMMYGQEYALADLYGLGRSLLQEMRTAAEALGRIYARTVRVVQQGEPALWRELGLPEATYGAIRLCIDESIATLIGRFDFAVTPSGVKMLEFNSDTPTGIVEAFHVNGRICAAYGAEDPNRGCSRQLTEAFGRLLQAYREQGYAAERVVFSALDWHEEDAGTTRYLLRQSGIAGASFAALADLRLMDERLWAPAEASGECGPLRPVDVWYRLHALEKLAEDRDADGFPTGEEALRLTAERRVAIINPPSGFVAQTKALQALIWNLHEAGEFYTPEEHEAIGRYMLPTYLEPRFASAGIPYVAKPIFGREGSDVTIYGADGLAAERSAEDEYADQPMVYQQYVQLPEIETETLAGRFRGSLLWGCFLIGGAPSAVIARVGGKITGNLSYYMPAALI